MKKKLIKTLRRLGCRRAATLTEYTFIVAIVSIAGVVLLITIGKSSTVSLKDSGDRMFGSP